MNPRSGYFSFFLMQLCFVGCAGFAFFYGLAAEVAFGLGAVFGVSALFLALGLDRKRRPSSP